MTEWTKQAEEMFKAWGDAQKNMMEKWVENVKSFSGMQDPELWNQTINTWEETAKNSFNSQAEWMQGWIERFKEVEGLPEQALTLVDRFQEMGERWKETQGQIWDKWFEMLKDFDPTQTTDKWLDASKQPIQAWQQATQKLLDAQSEWFNIWTGGGEKPKEE